MGPNGGIVAMDSALLWFTGGACSKTVIVRTTYTDLLYTDGDVCSAEGSLQGIDRQLTAPFRGMVIFAQIYAYTYLHSLAQTGFCVLFIQANT